MKDETPNFNSLSKEEQTKLIEAKKKSIETENVAKIENIIHTNEDTKVAKWQYQTMFAFMTLLPLVILLGSFAIYFKKYNISEERYDEICAEIAKRKLAAEGSAEVVLDGADAN